MVPFIFVNVVRMLLFKAFLGVARRSGIATLTARARVVFLPASTNEQASSRTAVTGSDNSRHTGRGRVHRVLLDGHAPGAWALLPASQSARESGTSSPLLASKVV